MSWEQYQIKAQTEAFKTCLLTELSKALPKLNDRHVGKLRAAVEGLDIRVCVIAQDPEDVERLGVAVVSVQRKPPSERTLLLV